MMDQKIDSKKILIALLLILLVVAAALLGAEVSQRLTSHNARRIKRAQAPLSAVGIPSFSHIFVIVEENHNSTAIFNNPEASFINNMASQYSVATNYHAITRPSLPNYLYLTSGTNGGITDDCNPPSETCQVDAPNIADRIEKANRNWKAYMESMPQNCDTSAYQSPALYDIEHNPFVYYKNILSNPERCNEHVVPLTELQDDIKDNDKLPDFVFIAPDRCNDMHDCDVATGDIWLASTVTKILDSPAFTDQNSLLAITWDEGEEGNKTNNVPLILIGPSVKRFYKSSTRYNHYSLLHTIEEAWGLEPLTNNDKTAPLLQEFFIP